MKVHSDSESGLKAFKHAKMATDGEAVHVKKMHAKHAEADAFGEAVVKVSF